MTIGERIKQKREELNLSQDELAKRLGYKSRSSINKIELNQRNLTQSKIKAIADALETTPAYIMGWDEKDNLERIQYELEIAELISNRYGSNILKVFQDYISLNEKEREKLSEMLSKYITLDEIDRAEIRGYIFSKIDTILQSEKYSIQEESKHA